MVLFVISLITSAEAQTTTISGFVTEAVSHEAIPFANVILKGTSIGTLTDTSGKFELILGNDKIESDSLIISHLIYDNKVIRFEVNKTQFLQIELQGNFLMLNEVVIKPGENPAWPILRRVISNKAINNRITNTNYSCREYAKTRFDLNHFTEKIKKNILVKPFDYIWDNVNTTSDGVKYLPLLLVEKVIDHHFQANPQQNRDVIQAVNTVGLPGKKMLEFTEDLYFTPNFYDNYVLILEKNFPSPLNDDYTSHHKFYLLDSFYQGQRKSYVISFKPKTNRGLAFNGEMIIDSTTSALQSIKLQFNILANINFVRSYVMEQKFEAIEPSHWMLTESSVLGDFTVMENVSEMTGFFGRKKSTYANYRINQEFSDPDLFSHQQNILDADSAMLRTPQYWTAMRSENLTTEEIGILSMVNRLEGDPKYKLRKRIIQSMITGYMPLWLVDIGNIYTFYSGNPIEKSRLKFGMRTSSKANKQWNAALYGAYGTRDEQFKYGFTTAYRFALSPKRQFNIGGSYTDDLVQLGRSFNQLPFDHIFSSWVALDDSDNSFHYTKNFNLFGAVSWTSGFSTRLNYFHNAIRRTNGEVFTKKIASDILLGIDEFKTAGIGMTLKYNWQNPTTTSEFYNKSDLGNSFRKYPDMAIEWKYADKNLFGSDFDYQKIKASLRQQFHVAKYGFSKYYIEFGKTFGTVPYTHLEVPFGNPLVFYDDQAFNLMNFLEYVSDEYVTIDVQHHFDGAIMDHVPLINRLKWRSFIFGKAYFGSLTDKNNQEIYQFSSGINPTTKPYYEVGFGFENIFKIARMDFVWRLTDRDHEGIRTFLIKPSFSFSF